MVSFRNQRVGQPVTPFGNLPRTSLTGPTVGAEGEVGCDGLDGDWSAEGGDCGLQHGICCEFCVPLHG